MAADPTNPIPEEEDASPIKVDAEEDSRIKASPRQTKETKTTSMLYSNIGNRKQRKNLLIWSLLYRVKKGRRKLSCRCIKASPLKNSSRPLQDYEDVIDEYDNEMQNYHF